MSKIKLYFVLALSLLAMGNGFSQDKKPSVKETDQQDNIIMTWNKNTPEQEMKDDIKALAEHGVTISYSNVKRNSKEEITAIKVEYADKSGSKGAMELDNQKPINTVKFFKQGDEVGFGEPADSNLIAGNFPNGQNFMKQFNFGNGDEKSQSYNFTFPDKGAFGQSGSKIIIQNDGKKPLVIEDGKVIEGGEDYTTDELNKIKEENQGNSFGGGDMFGSNFNSDNGNMEQLNQQMENMQEQLNELMSKSDREKPNSEDEKTIKELNKTKEEMLKAKAEMEKTTKELKKAKSNLKTQKA